MPLVTSEKMLLDAKKDGYAVGAFNVENMEMVKAVIAAAEELNAPVMLQTTPSTVKYGTLETFAGIVKAEAAKTKIPVCLHLDHGNSFELAVQAMKAGYTSVMIDGSHEDFENNIAVTKKVVDVPLVLHGASGLSEEDVRECVERGMCKVNFATELRVAYTDAVKKLLEEKPETFDPKKLGVVAMEAVKEQVIARMKMCGCDGKAK